MEGVTAEPWTEGCFWVFQAARLVGLLGRAGRERGVHRMEIQEGEVWPGEGTLLGGVECGEAWAI